ncbi:HAMP domain-containing sensor histidine kinase [Kitasatospora camelliae]|uniref:Signal transduction histidine-protein kinase/phosphatase MprB n=1 Tax=Kitasatospora camelliae TaxID=3156397 RepID=A0AAU8JP59_9ACTN
MRRSLAGVALAVTSMVALAFLIPLGVLVADQARKQSTTAAEQRAAALAPVLALTTGTADLQQAVSGLDPGDGLGVHLPDGRRLGAEHAPAELLRRAMAEGESIAQDVPGGWLYLQPVVLGEDGTAVVEEFVPDADLTRGVTASWAVMSLLAVGLIAGSVLVADRLGAQVVRSSRTLSRASHALGAGDLEIRVEPGGPRELRDAGQAFNAMADRMVGLLATERELVADLSHRLRTPLTALHLATDRMAPGPDTRRIGAAVAQLEEELNSIIAAARTPLATGPMGRALTAPEGSRAATAAVRVGTRSTGTAAAGPRAEAAEVIRHRAGFWATLAGHQDRTCRLEITSEPTPVQLPEDDLTAVIDSLVGNVFRHTPPGTAFAVRVERTAQSVELTVEDAGPGIDDPDGALARGASTGSTGLGLDIARRAAAATAGSLRIDRGRLGGARITLSLGLACADPTAGPGRRTRRRGRRGPAH